MDNLIARVASTGIASLLVLLPLAAEAQNQGMSEHSQRVARRNAAFNNCMARMGNVSGANYECQRQAMIAVPDVGDAGPNANPAQKEVARRNAAFNNCMARMGNAPGANYECGRQSTIAVPGSVTPDAGPGAGSGAGNRAAAEERRFVEFQNCMATLGSNTPGAGDECRRQAVIAVPYQ